MGILGRGDEGWLQGWSRTFVHNALYHHLLSLNDTCLDHYDNVFPCFPVLIFHSPVIVLIPWDSRLWRCRLGIILASWRKLTQEWSQHQSEALLELRETGALPFRWLKLEASLNLQFCGSMIFQNLCNTYRRPGGDEKLGVSVKAFWRKWWPDWMAKEEQGLEPHRAWEGEVSELMSQADGTLLRWYEGRRALETKQQ